MQFLIKFNNLKLQKLAFIFSFYVKIFFDVDDNKKYVNHLFIDYDESDQESIQTTSNFDLKSRDMIPLHAGSDVYVPKSDLIRIYTTNPAVYTGRLAELVFGRDSLVNAKVIKGDNKTNILTLDSIKLKSILGLCMNNFSLFFYL